MEPITLYLTLLLAGFILIGLEIFIPGGILGIFGSLAWISAAIIGWRNFPEPWDFFSAIALLGAGIFTFIVWIRYFPKSRIGKSLSLEQTGSGYKSHTDNGVKVGDSGEAVSTLRPSGIARINGTRVDVVADGEWIESGQSIKVSSTSGGHISVVKV
ncbi:MAG TPA: NfeD family protein [Pontiella sp.]